MEKETFLNLDDLYSNHIRRDKNKLKFYEDIYKKCVLKIKKTNKELQTFECCYTVPAFVLGGPVYDYGDLKNYLLFKLHNNGIYAEYIDHKTLYISWKPEDINRQKYEKKLEKYRQSLENKYNVHEDQVIERTIKHKKNARDNVTSEETRIGVLQYNNKIKDLVPINPNKINKYRPPENLPNVPRPNYHNLMLKSRLAQQVTNPIPSNYLANNLNNYMYQRSSN